MVLMRMGNDDDVTHCFLAISQGGRVDFKSPDASRVEEEGVRLANLRFRMIMMIIALYTGDDADDDEDYIANG